MHPLYMTDSYLKEFSAAVEQVDGKSIVLDNTAFYPQGGGVPNDLGTIEKDGEMHNVINVFKKDGKIWHEIDKDGLQVGDNINCKIDWERRYRLMKMHTAAHIIDAVLYKVTGALSTGNQLGLEKSRIDFSLETFDKEKIQKYIDAANEIISSAIDVKIYFLGREEAMKIPGIVKLANALPPQIDELRIVEIPPVDIQADGGPQVANTKEIGKVVLLSVDNRGKNNRRIYFTLK